MDWVVGYSCQVLQSSFLSGFNPQKQEQALRYLDQYTKNMFKVHVYWGDVDKFSEELRARWEKFKD